MIHIVVNDQYKEEEKQQYSIIFCLFDPIALAPRDIHCQECNRIVSTHQKALPVETRFNRLSPSARGPVTTTTQPFESLDCSHRQ